jgi:hypothetical protein
VGASHENMTLVRYLGRKTVGIHALTGRAVRIFDTIILRALLTSQWSFGSASLERWNRLLR